MQFIIRKWAEFAAKAVRKGPNLFYGFELAWEPAICAGVDRLKDGIVISFDREAKSSADRPGR